MTPTRDERIEEIRGRVYGNTGTTMPYSSTQCAEPAPHGFQCQFEPGLGLGGLYCKQHAKNNPEIENG